jgi:DNA-binding response OmpR family regulator
MIGKMARIIVVEDDLAQQEEILSFLTYAGHDAQGAANGTELHRCLQQFSPEIVLLDFNLPGESGAELAAGLRERYGLDLGIVMVTARSQLADRLQSRRAGADDYLVKPVDFDEMLAVIDNLLLRLEPPTAPARGWKLLLARSELQPPDGPAVPLTHWEMSLLKTLAGEPQHKVGRDALIRALGKDPDVYDPRALEASISRLRRKLPKLEDGRNPLQAMRGSGYQFIRPLVSVN